MCNALSWMVDLWYAIVYGNFHITRNDWNIINDPKHFNYFCLYSCRTLIFCLSSSWKINRWIEPWISIVLQKNNMFNRNHNCLFYIAYTLLWKICYCFLLYWHPPYTPKNDLDLLNSSYCRIFQFLLDLAVRHS